MIFCLVPADLAVELHDVLRAHFHDDPSVSVVVELRQAERRRAETWGEQGRRLAERRSPMVTAGAPTLPRRARRHASRIVFFERREPEALRDEDVETSRAIARAQAGSSDGFNEVYLRYFDRVYGYMRVATGDRHEAEDLTQQVFLQALLGLESYEIRLDKPFRTWLFTIARYRVIDHLRKHGRVDVTAPDDMHGLGPQASASHEESLDWISDGEMLLFVERLPLPQRQVLILRHLVGLRTSEIADVLDRTQDSVRQLDSRARSFLATRLAAVGHRPESLQRDASERPLRQAVVLRRRRFALGTQRAGLR